MVSSSQVLGSQEDQVPFRTLRLVGGAAASPEGRAHSAGLPLHVEAPHPVPLPWPPSHTHPALALPRPGTQAGFGALGPGQQQCQTWPRQRAVEGNAQVSGQGTERPPLREPQARLARLPPTSHGAHQSPLPVPRVCAIVPGGKTRHLRNPLAGLSVSIHPLHSAGARTAPASRPPSSTVTVR